MALEGFESLSVVLDFLALGSCSAAPSLSVSAGRSFLFLLFDFSSDAGVSGAVSFFAFFFTSGCTGVFVGVFNTLTGLESVSKISTPIRKNAGGELRTKISILRGFRDGTYLMFSFVSLIYHLKMPLYLM